MMDTAPETAQHAAITNGIHDGQSENLLAPSFSISTTSTKNNGKRRDVSSHETDEDDDDGYWRTYPENLSDIDPVLEDVRFWRERLGDVGKAFCSQPEDSIRVLDIGPKGKGSDNQSEGPDGPGLAQRIHSQLKIVSAVECEQLALTLHGLRRLLSASQISPNILPCIFQRTGCGTKVHFMDETDQIVRERKSYSVVVLSAINIYVTLELWFSLPLPAEDSTKYEVERSTFWLDYAPATGLSDFFCLEIRRKMEKKLHRIKDMFVNRSMRASDFTLFIFESALKAWRDAVHVAVYFVHVANYDFIQHNSWADIDVSRTMAKINALATGMSKYARSITEICSLIAFVKRRRWTASSQGGKNRKQAHFAQYEELVANFQSLSGVVEGLKEEVQIKKSLIVHRIALRNDDTMVANSKAMKRIAINAEEGTRSMAGIAKQARDDSRAMKVLAVVTMSYLPWTAVATIFSMDFLSLEKDNNGFKAVGKIWIYFSVAAPLTFLTFLVWILYYYKFQFQGLLRRAFSLKAWPKANEEGDNADDLDYAAVVRAIAEAEAEMARHQQLLTEKCKEFEQWTHSDRDEMETDDERRLRTEALTAEVQEMLSQHYERGERLSAARAVLKKYE